MTRFIPHDQDRENQKVEDKAERRALRNAPAEDVDESMARFEGLNPEDPEFESVIEFAEFLSDNDEIEFDHRHLLCLNVRTRLPVHEIRSTLEGYGFALKTRGKERTVRGFSANPHDRWSAYPSHGGGGGGSIVGMAD